MRARVRGPTFASMLLHFSMKSRFADLLFNCDTSLKFNDIFPGDPDCQSPMPKNEKKKEGKSKKGTSPFNVVMKDEMTQAEAPTPS